MELILRVIEFIIYTILIVFITKNYLVKVIRRLGNSLDLDSNLVGDIAGVSTSIPELISVFFTALEGMFTAGIFNILSSNIINLIQYTISIYKNRNQQIVYENDALKSDIIMVIITILLPLIIIGFNIELNMRFVPIFILLFILFYIINRNTHKLYLPKMKDEFQKEIEEEKRWIKGKRKVLIKNIIYLFIIGIILYTIGELLGNVVKKLSVTFRISEMFIGIALGFVTSIPELITFLESQRYSKKNKQDIQGVVEATNNLLTSNIINLFVVLTIGIVVIAIA